ncbi:MAG: primosomal protein N' [Alphaproteobacteria bacterium]|nr:primosomal protein N' [Alphaproteobacteria bacterium]
MTSSPATLRVLLPLPLADAYDYLPLAGQATEPGTVVEVPLGQRQMLGVVWGPGEGGVPEHKLKSILGTSSLPPIPEASRNFVDWVSQYTLTPSGAVLKMLFGSMRMIQPKKNDDYSSPLPDPGHHQPKLTPDQKKAADVLIEKVKAQEYSVTLLDGVTGSGKTETFCEAIAECLRQGKQALVLLPEIAMTAALIDRFAERFGVPPVQWHSELTQKQRRLNWHAIARGEAKFILGARSALFLPYPDLGLIVVDEEHEAAYKQEEGVIYHGRDMAVVRAHLGNIPIILSSATPSLETMFNVQQKKYDHVVLHERFGKAAMPKIELVDLRQHKLSAQQFISPPLFEALQQTIEEKHQAMLFLNRRGYAPLTLCRACGHRLQCPNCTSWMIEHKQSGKLLCHHCDHAMRLPEKCPSCSAEGRFAACGPGVERVAEEIKVSLPKARFAIMASDTLSGPKEAQALVNQMANRELDLLIGTQIMAKGYHFPRLTLVGVVDADLGLAGGDPRAAERTFQLLQQVSGRSGRGDEPGRVLLQTTAPEHPVMKALLKGDRDEFMATELKERETYRLPPVWRLASVTVSGANIREVIQLAEELATKAPQNEKLRVLGPAPAPFAMLRGRYRHRLMVQAPRTVNLSRVLREWLGRVKPPRSLRILVDVDPYSFL